MDEADPRPFVAVSIGMTSHESGAERFVKDGIYTPPPIATWRCNLTALSQRFNLYFSAHRSGVAVYVPDFPFNRLHRTPKLFIPPSLSDPEAKGYIDPSHPHCINHLIVGDLGTEEILLVSTDSGNIAAYHTKAISEAIKKDPYRYSSDARSDHVGLRAFFCQYVRESAWGLAIHRDARLIAVSANVPSHASVQEAYATITVYAFALTSNQESPEVEEEEAPDVNAELGEEEWEEWFPQDTTSSAVVRDRNLKVRLTGAGGHGTNVPSISFFPTKQDPTGQYLVSTDILGNMKLWQIWQASCRNTWSFSGDGHRGFAPIASSEAGWIVAALDPAGFRETSSMQQFCGHHRAPKSPENPGESYDLTNIARLTIPGRSSRHPLLNSPTASSADEDEDEAEEDREQVAGHWSDEEVEDRASASFDEADDGPPPETPAEAQVLVGLPIPHARRRLDSRNMEELLLDHYNSELESSDYDLDTPSDTGDDGRATISQGAVTSPDSFASVTPFSDISQRSSVDVELGPMTISSPNRISGPSPSAMAETSATKRRRQEQRREHETGPTVPDIPVLHCSTTNLRLIDVPGERMAHVYCNDILQQRLPPAYHVHGYNSLRRLNMFQHIPELGVVVLASQLGRCAVCTLTRHPETDTRGLRVDWILPTKKQERAGQRPNCWLLGLAAAPMQGQIPSSSENEVQSGVWGQQESNIDGVQVSFDSSVYVLPEPTKNFDEVDSDEEESRSRTTKRHRRVSGPSTSSSNASTQRRPWQNPTVTDGPRRVEGSRRYRLLLTYADMTVLTYELSRDLNREGVETQPESSDDEI
jgi:hypothetical protein